MRTVIEGESVSNAIDERRAQYPRLIDAFEALKWWLAHKPETGELMDDRNWIYRQKGKIRPHIPSLVVVYTFDHQSVNFIHILIED